QNGKQVEVERIQALAHSEPASVDSTNVDVQLHSDLRRKGLLWFSLYDVKFQGVWRYRHRLDFPTQLAVVFRFPDPAGVYDNFSFVVDGKDFAASAAVENGAARVVVP